MLATNLRKNCTQLPALQLLTHTKDTRLLRVALWAAAENGEQEFSMGSTAHHPRTSHHSGKESSCQLLLAAPGCGQGDGSGSSNDYSFFLNAFVLSFIFLGQKGAGEGGRETAGRQREGTGAQHDTAQGVGHTQDGGCHRTSAERSIPTVACWCLLNPQPVFACLGTPQ